jgi:glyoxylase-like metal-dependent hydrolase (beta-lactamase superfamily II)
VRAVSLHRDVIVVTSALLQVNCVIVRGVFEQGAEDAQGEVFVIDSPVLPDELDALPALLEQAHFPAPSGLLATHGDWDHVLGSLAFPGVPLGCAESTAERMQRSPGEAQRELRSFDEELAIERTRPLALGAIQALPVPGRCEIGEAELELHPFDGHTVDGMAISIPWARTLVTGDYVSPVEIPTLNDPNTIDAYLATLERLRLLLAQAEHVVPGHGPVIDSVRALSILEQDVEYLTALGRSGADADLPAGRRSRQQRRLHVENVSQLRRSGQ